MLNKLNNVSKELENNEKYFESSKERIVFANSSLITLRSKPSADEKILDFIPSGSKATITGNFRDGFTEIMYNKITGWVKDECLKTGV